MSSSSKTSKYINCFKLTQISSLVQAQYWNDPFLQDDYKDRSIFLADINLDRSSPNQKQYRDNIVRLQNMVLVQFLQDEMIVPKESEVSRLAKP